MDGLNRYTHNTVSELEAIQTNSVVFTSAVENFKNVFRTPGFLSTYGFRGNINRLIWLQTVLPLLLKKTQASIYYSPISEGMLFPVCNQIITIHDVLPILFPEVYPRLRYQFKYILPTLAKKSDMIVAISHSTRKDLMKYFNIAEEKITVIYPAYNDTVFYRKESSEVSRMMNKYGIDSEYLLCVGEIRPYKNISGLIKAFSLVKSEKVKLMIVGKISRLTKEILKLPESLGIQDKVKFLGFVPDDDLACLYSGTKGFVFPSLYEGFGLPPLEAMACGTAVIASKTSSIPEVCGEAALYFDPHDIEDMASRLGEFLDNEDLNKQLRQKALHQVRQFSYKKAAKQLNSIIEKVSEN